MNFVEQLEHETRAEREGFKSIGLVQYAIANGVDRETYLDFLSCAYHHVKQTVPLLDLAASLCGPEDADVRKALLDYIDEEKGHDEWILDDIRDFGGDAEAVRNDPGPLVVRVMCAHAYYNIERVSPYCLLGMVHVLEGMSVALAHAAAGAIRSKLARTDGKGFSYLMSHGSLDESHVAFYNRLLARIDTPERRRVVIQAAKDFYILYGDIFRYLGRRMEERAHAA